MSRIQLPDDRVDIPKIAPQYTHADMVGFVEASIAEMRALIKDVPDSYVTFLPDDPDASDAAAATPEEVHLAWKLGHNVVHYNASGEEVASIASILARGIEVNQRVRWEVPWQTVTTTQHCLDLLEQSERMRLSYFNAWPDSPNLGTEFFKYKDWIGPMNAVAYAIFGLMHDYSHLDQVAKIIRQAQEKGI